MEPYAPEEKEQKFIFISYAHKDEALVMPIAHRLQQDGYQVWYDREIIPGSRWDEHIAAHVKDCSLFLSFLSANYFASDNCCDELNFARDLDKPRLMVYLENAELPRGMAMRIGRSGAVRRYEYAEEEDFFAALYETAAMAHFRDGQAAEAPGTAPQRTRSRRTLPGWQRGVLAVVLAAALLCALLVLFPGNHKEDTSPDETTEAPHQTLTSEVLLDTDILTITALETSVDDTYFILNLAIENKLDQMIYPSFYYTFINGVYFETLSSIQVEAGELAFAEVCVRLEDMEKYGIAPSDVSVIETVQTWNVYRDGYGDNPIRYCPQGEENARYIEYVPNPEHQVIAQTEDISVVMSESVHNTEDGTWNQTLLLHNNTDLPLVFYFEDMCINGGQRDEYYFLYTTGFAVPPGTLWPLTVQLSQKQWQLVGEDYVYFQTGTLKVESQFELSFCYEIDFAIYPDQAMSELPTAMVLDVEDHNMDLTGEMISEWWYRSGKTQRALNRHDIGYHYLYAEEYGEYLIDHFLVWNKTDTELDLDLGLYIIGSQEIIVPLHLNSADLQIVMIPRSESYNARQSIWVMFLDEEGNYADLDGMSSFSMLILYSKEESSE